MLTAHPTPKQIPARSTPPCIQREYAVGGDRLACGVTCGLAHFLYEKDKMRKLAANATVTLVLSILLCITSIASAQQQTTISDSAAATRIAWWRDAKFGLFMHWGVYSIPGR